MADESAASLVLLRTRDGDSSRDVDLRFLALDVAAAPAAVATGASAPALVALLLVRNDGDDGELGGCGDVVVAEGRPHSLIASCGTCGIGCFAVGTTAATGDAGLTDVRSRGLP